jgi:antitoxin HicB
MKMVKNLRYTINIERDEDGIFVVSVPALPGCFTQGRTLDEAFRMAQDAIRGFLKVFVSRGKKIPIERVQSNPFTVSVEFPDTVPA